MNVNLHCFILRTTTVAGLGVPIFRVITVNALEKAVAFLSYRIRVFYF